MLCIQISHKLFSVIEIRHKNIVGRLYTDIWFNSHMSTTLTRVYFIYNLQACIFNLSRILIASRCGKIASGCGKIAGRCGMIASRCDICRLCVTGRAALFVVFPFGSQILQDVGHFTLVQFKSSSTDGKWQENKQSCVELKRVKCLRMTCSICNYVI